MTEDTDCVNMCLKIILPKNKKIFKIKTKKKCRNLALYLKFVYFCFQNLLRYF